MKERLEYSPLDSELKNEVTLQKKTTSRIKQVYKFDKNNT